jgi:hypothetical protein
MKGMTTFFETARGELVNADLIEWISDEAPIARLKGGKEVELDNPWLDRMPVIQANPGFTHLLTYDGAPSVRRLPVVAWRVGADALYPVTLAGDNIGAEGIATAVLMPDGRVFCACVEWRGLNETFPDEAVWLKEVARTRREIDGKPTLRVATARAWHGCRNSAKDKQCQYVAEDTASSRNIKLCARQYSDVI